MKYFAVFLLLPALASADPGPATRWLINEPASMMEDVYATMTAALNEQRDTLLNHIHRQSVRD